MIRIPQSSGKSQIAEIQKSLFIPPHQIIKAFFNRNYSITDKKIYDTWPCPVK